jgi:ubiquinone/menaquinone biosynthesis C-methylase UbiE
VQEYYSTFGDREWTRLDTPSGALEFEINTRIIRRYLDGPSRILDIGGGPGRYALWLASLGHEVTLADLSSRLLEIARERIADSPFREGIEEVVEADARDLSQWGDSNFDAVLCLGPFYHLPNADDRETAAAELSRVIRAGGYLFAAFMPWQALLRRTAVVPQERHRLTDEGWVTRLLKEGVFENDVPGRFDMGFGASPQRISPLFEGIGFETLGLFASEGLGAGIEESIADLRESDPEGYEALIRVVVSVADDPSLFGLSTHLLYVGRVK